MDLETFETERLFLKKLTPAELGYIYENYSRDDIIKILGIHSDDEFIEEENKYKGGYATYNRSFVYFQLIEKASHEIIGGGGLHNWFPAHSRAELGYALDDDKHKDKGFMTEAISFFIGYGFEIMKLHRIEAFIGPSNIASLKLVAKHNFVKEGQLRQHYFKEGSFEDSVVFSLLREDYLRAGS
ncbi:MAG: GNAT family protein [Ferruginibacter sp.]